MLTKLAIFNSLKARLILSALLLVLVLLPIIAIALSSAFERQLITSHKDRLNTYIYSILAVTEVNNGEVYTPETLVDDQFNLVNSGLYALISAKTNSHDANHVVWQSQSLLGIKLDIDLSEVNVGQIAFSSKSLDGKPSFVFSYGVNFTARGKNFPITLHVIQDKTGFYTALSEFNHQLWRSLAVLMLFLLVAQISWLAWTLRPLARFKQELNQVEQGEKIQVTGDYPNELADVAHQLNTLLSTEQNQRKRYRNALSDLAHSLKTPLAVIQSQTDLNSASKEQIGAINNIINHQLKRAQTAAGASWHLGVKLKPISDKLIRTLGKIYSHPSIHLNADVSDKLIFKGDEADITEILGNLLDNACKAARSQVSMSITPDPNKLIINIEDDGKGISKEKASQICERGVRADTYEKGHGIGLAIVSDLIDSYGGSLQIQQSEKLGGAHFICTFNK